MSSELRAIPDALSQVGTELAGHGELLADLQRSCHRAADGAQPGWIASSAGALSGLLDQWLRASATHLARFGEHSNGMRAAAAGFAELDRHNAATLQWR